MTSAETTAPAVPAKAEVASWRLVVTLALAGALAAALLSIVYELTLPAIEANKARVMEEAIGEVLKGPATVVSLKVGPDALQREETVVYAVNDKEIDRVFVGYDAAGKAIGYALVGGAYGYGWTRSGSCSGTTRRPGRSSA